MMKVCPLCEREIPPDQESRHHLVPKLRGGSKGPIAILHRVCHTKIHSLFSETDLARQYHTIDLLLEHKEIRKFVNWVKRRPISYRSSNRRSRTR